ncbi:hypothetical protein I551_4248 [Mycobacterium ulcerans str. Harvey]|uniref:Uncharacterized protein n=1 Tax=Mycobacterium ulcerans str. Harvey TaxID=1299332 RepID=A0ABP3AHY0_MYCUL|nr:hypothetical protein I551_4248 [Mycobacterium ulcerans str. Harvey]
MSVMSARWPARLKFNNPNAEIPATSHEIARTGRVRRWAVNNSPPT